ncbi:MAG: SDR family oxidoreductase [Acetobacteraceae bacterium]|nr:SDR family oxidoreductase [Acetobacteraceae bacterium]
MPKILIIGASQGIGLEALKQALASGYEVRAMARSANKISIEHPSLEKVVGNALDRDHVEAALDGIDVVVQALGVPADLQALFGPVQLFSESTRILVPAMARAGVGRLICVTGFGAGDSRERLGSVPSIPFRIFLGRVYDDKDIQEQIVRGSGLHWTIVRPVLLTNGVRTGRYQVLEDPKRWRGGFISRADVADFLIKSAQTNAYLWKTPVLAY